MREHGGDVYRASEETGIPVSEIIDFSASINPLGLPDSVVAAIRESVPLVVHYPDPFAEVLGRRLAERLDLEPATVICGNGSTELIYLLVRALAPRRVLIPQPTFSEYERACLMQQGTQCLPFRLLPDNGFSIDPGRFSEALADCDMAFLCNPNNPTGTVLKRDEVLAIAEAARQRSCRLVVDEAFIDFCPENSVIHDVARNSHLLVLRSLTKFYALSGLRVGYAVLLEEDAAATRRLKEPWTVNTLAQYAALAAIDDAAFRKRTMAFISEEKKYLEAAFRSSGIECLPSAANYYLLRSKQAADIIQLRKQGILVRNCANFSGLDDTYIRVAVRSRVENERLLKELAAVCAA